MERILHALAGRTFQKGIDIGCGEGHATAALPVRDMTGVDFSEIAIHRAAKRYPHIKFETADILDLSRFPEGAFDFVSCLELLYYLKPEQQTAAIAQLKRLGTANSTYLFSVVTKRLPENIKANYHTTESAMALLSAHFKIKDMFAVTLATRLPYWRRALVSLKLDSKTAQRKKYLFSRASLRAAYQTAFICDTKF
jgi:trans-aconitate methyltransferase